MTRRLRGLEVLPDSACYGSRSEGKYLWIYPTGIVGLLEGSWSGPSRLTEPPVRFLESGWVISTLRLQWSDCCWNRWCRQKMRLPYS